MLHRVRDWDSAYANAAHIPRSERWPDAWAEPARVFREAALERGRARLDLSYGDGLRQRLDLFLPEGAPRGLFVFVHGGYWHTLDRSYWSHFAGGPLARGFAVAVPGYTLCPEVRIRDIAVEIASAVRLTASMVEGPLVLAGHSAGGQLVARLATRTSPLPAATLARLKVVVPISGVNDLRPLMRTRMNDILRIDSAEAASESPCLLEPVEGLRVLCWVGGGERAEFRRLSRVLSDIWIGVGAETELIEEPDRHHFDILDGLQDPLHPVLDRIFSA